MASIPENEIKKGMNVREYIHSCSSLGYKKEQIKNRLVEYGIDPAHLDKEFRIISRKKSSDVIVFLAFILVFMSIFMFKPSFTGFAVNSGYEGLIWPSADYNKETGLIYQGLSSDNSEKIIGASVQGKQKGSVNIIDFNNDGKADLLTTGFYLKDGEEIPVTNLYRDLISEIGSYTNVKNSGSCWADFNNDGFIEPAMIGDSNGNLIMEIYSNKNGELSIKQSLEGFRYGAIKCSDIDKDGWIDIVASGISFTGGAIKFYKNIEGTLQLETELDSIAYSDLTVNDFDNDNLLDFIVSGDSQKGYETLLYSNNGNSFSKSKIIQDSISLPSLSSGDYNNDGNTDFVISGNEGITPKTVLYKNLNGFEKDNIDLISLMNSKVLFLDINKDNNLELFNTGQKQISGVPTYYAESVTLEQSGKNTPPNPPTNLSFEKYDYTYLKLKWSPATDDHTKYLFYQVRAGTEFNSNRFLSGFLSDEKGNAELTDFKLLKDPKECFFFQVKSIDGAYAESEWSEKFLVNCQQTINQSINETTNTTLNETPEIPNKGTIQISSNPSDADIFIDNELKGKTTVTIELTEGEHDVLLKKEDYIDWKGKITIQAGKKENLKVNLEQSKPDIWYHDLIFNNIKYHAEYQRQKSYTFVKETIINDDIYPHSNIRVIHSRRFEIQEKELEQQFKDMRDMFGEDAIEIGGFYDLTDQENVFSELGMMQPGQKKIISIKLSKDIPYNNVLPTQIESKVEKQPELKQNITAIIKQTENKTIISLNVSLNESTLAAKDVYVKQTIPKCLLEKLTELELKSGRVVSNKEFTVLESDPVIMWHFSNVIDPEALKLEIEGVADENCTNQIVTEIVAKKLLAEKDNYDTFLAIVEILAPIMFILCFFWVFNYLKRDKIWKETSGYVLIALCILIILYEFFDTIAMLPPSLDLLKKLMSWIGMIIFIAYLDLATLFFGRDNNTRLRQAFNFLTISGFICLSIKNIIFAAFETYGSEKLFSNMTLLIIKYSSWLATNLFFLGIVLLCIAVLIAWIGFRIKGQSFSELVGKTDTVFVGAKFNKLIFIFILIIGFFAVFFSFLFDWLSIGVDSPFFILALIIAFKEVLNNKVEESAAEKLAKTTDKSESYMEEFINLFRHKSNIFIAFSFFPIMIFIVETYSYLAYFFAGIKNLYFDAIEFTIPTLGDIIKSNNFAAVSIYLIQSIGLLSALILAFWFWWHFFKRREGNEYKPDSRNYKFFVLMLLLGCISFVLKPSFNLISLDNKEVSGTMLVFRNGLNLQDLTMHFIILGITALIAIFLLRKKIFDILAYGITLLLVCIFAFMFVKSFVMRIINQIFFSNSLISIGNSVFLILLILIYVLVMCISIYALVGEFIALFWEDFGHKEQYRKLVKKFFSHRLRIEETKIHDLKIKAIQYKKEGHDDYWIEERLHKETKIPIREIKLVLKILEFDTKEYLKIGQFHQIEHLEELRHNIKVLYREKNIAIEDIIEKCKENGWTEDDIAAACLHIRPKQIDKILFREMKRDIGQEIFGN